ncbi:MAG TPA: orotidine-5'-phosphate decarboxylase [Chitinispirillaceae bacterium]|nr:orotidine-5'-phosphate decarboxylase [Chitinispirillaceae bacterium]
MNKNKFKLALALDNVSTIKEIQDLVHQTSESIGVYKIGLEQFTRFGAPVLSVVRNVDCRIFLDLKFHDIPNTVAKAVASACDLGVQYLTIHTQGGIEMMKAAVEAAHKHSDAPPSIVGVTLLTSIGAEALKTDLMIPVTPVDYVKHLASCALKAGLAGIVCSAADLPSVRTLLPEEFIKITPGIRPEGTDSGDQARIATPQEAIKNGASILVIGRPITGAKDPGLAAHQILESISA